MKYLIISIPIMLCTALAGCGGGSGDSSLTDTASTADAASAADATAYEAGTKLVGRRAREAAAAAAAAASTTDTTSSTTTSTTPTTTTSTTTTPTTTTSTTTTTPTTTTTSTNTPYVSIDQVISDTSTASEAIPIDPRYGWQYKPAVTMYAPRGDAIPSWWSGNRPTWTYILQSWFTTFEAQGNAASNSRVQLKDLRIYVLSESTRKWTLIDKKSAPMVELWSYPFTFAGPDAGERIEPTGGYSVKPDYPHFQHGYGSKTTIVPQDVRAVFAAMDFRLVLDNPSGPDDRASAKYVVDSGGDYYPGNGQTWSLGYAPGVGNGRYLLATPNWRTATMLVPNPNYGSTLSEIRNNPPPLR